MMTVDIESVITVTLRRIKYLPIVLVIAACTTSPVTKSTADDLNVVMTEFKVLEKGGAASGQTWFEFASKARVAGNLDIAKQALDRAERLEVSPIRIVLERTRLDVASKNNVGAVAHLQALLDTGFTAIGFISNDPVISSLTGNDAYDALISSMSAQAYPCRNQPGFKDFDFWVGEWDVTTANGAVAGSNSIKIAERGCVILESWTNTSGGTGMSINYLDMASGEWVQVWNAEAGSQINIRGGLTDKGMLMVGHLHTVGAGTTVPFRALFTLLPDGRVRQFFEQSNDEGATWLPWFEGFMRANSNRKHKG